MKDIKTCELCCEQIIKTEDFDNFNGDEKENLNIFKNLEITVSKDANICSECVNVSHLTYNFKTSSLANNDHLKTLVHTGINDKLILEEVVVKEPKGESKNEGKVCRFCLNFFEVNLLVEVNLEQDVILKDMLGRCLPDIDINIVQNPLICYICSELLEKLFNLISQCQHSEVLDNLDAKTDDLVNNNKPTVTATNNDDNIDKSFVKEENCEGLEDPELQIKSEDCDIGEDIKDSLNDGNYLLKESSTHARPSSSSSRLTHQQTHWKTRKSTTNKLYKCTECLFQFKYQRSFERHKEEYKKADKCNMCDFTGRNKCEIMKHKQKVHQNRAESGLYKCHKCPYITKWKRHLVVHNMRLHEDISKQPKYKCDECSFETLVKYSLVKHKLTHRDPSEVKMYKCMECSYETIRKGSLERHEKMHARNQQNAAEVEQSLSNPIEENNAKPNPRGTIKEKKFVCDICSHQTTTKYLLQQHCLIHKKSWEVNLFKCDYCPFATKWKNSIMVHTIRHKNPLGLRKFKCNDCPFETNWKSQLVKHVLMHKNPSQVNMYKCKVCPYQTKYKSCIVVHEKQHQVEIYTCDECNYKTESKTSFVLHLQNHKNEKPPAKSSQNLKKVQYKCSECNYTAVRKAHLIKHQMLHKDPSEREMYTCIECSFQALKKITLKRHYRKHHSSIEEPFGKLKTFRCDECDYETMYKKYILKHLQTHKQEKMTPSEKNNTRDKEGT